jgi:hypothetical protein
MLWSDPFCNTRSALALVGRMFDTRFGSLISRHNASARAVAASS